MILVFDIGNTNIHIGIYRNGNLIYTQNWLTKDGLNKNFINKLFYKNEIVGVGIASVVPQMSKVLCKYLMQFSIKPFLINANIRMPVKIAYNSLGADRIANINGGYIRYKDDLIISSLGTAITLDVVTKIGNHIGGIIMPGPDIQFWSLSQRTVLIKNIQLKSQTRLLGKNTNECIQSGVLNGVKFSIEKFVEAIKKIYKKNYRLVVTGGWAERLSNLTRMTIQYDKDLTLYGVYQLFKQNVKD